MVSSHPRHNGGLFKWNKRVNGEARREGKSRAWITTTRKECPGERKLAKCIYYINKAIYAKSSPAKEKHTCIFAMASKGRYYDYVAPKLHAYSPLIILFRGLEGESGWAPRAAKNIII
jgi:hypothetical protein